MAINICLFPAGNYNVIITATNRWRWELSAEQHCTALYCIASYHTFLYCIALWGERFRKLIFTDSAHRPIQSTRFNIRVSDVFVPSINDWNREGCRVLVEERITKIAKLRTTYFYKEQTWDLDALYPPCFVESKSHVCSSWQQTWDQQV